MPNTFVELKNLDPTRLDQLSTLHFQVMKTLLSELGIIFVRKYYDVVQNENGIIGICALSEQGKIIGWVIGSKDPAALNSKLRQPLSWFFAQILLTAIKHPFVLLELGRSVITTSESNKLDVSQCELTYIGVSPASQGRGLGKELISRFIERAKQSGYNSIALSVETDNLAAISLYSKCEFQITKTFQEGRFHRHRMVLEIQ